MKIPPLPRMTSGRQWPLVAALALGLIACDAVAGTWASWAANSSWLGRCVGFNEGSHGRVVAVNSWWSSRNPPELAFRGVPGRPWVVSGVSVTVGDGVMEFMTSDLRREDCP